MFERKPRREDCTRRRRPSTARDALSVPEVAFARANCGNYRPDVRGGSVQGAVDVDLDGAAVRHGLLRSLGITDWELGRVCTHVARAAFVTGSACINVLEVACFVDV